MSAPATPLDARGTTPGPYARCITRDADPGDNAALLALTDACPMDGDITLCVDRRPDFFALNRLEGSRWRVGVVAAEAGGLAGCVAIAERRAYLHGQPSAICYVSDLKVHPGHRGGPVADALTIHARQAVRTFGGDEVPTLITVLAGNASMERRTVGPRGLPRFTRVATIRTHSVPILGRRDEVAADGLRVDGASVADLEAMGEFWQRVAPARQFAPVLDANAFAGWIARAPSLDVADYLVARDRSGRIAGFLALWDQQAFKRLIVVRYSPRLAIARQLFNLAAPFVGAPPLPRTGTPLRSVSALHICVPLDRPQVLRALVLAAYDMLRGRGVAFLNLGLDLRDPLSRAMRGMLAQPTDVHAYITRPGGPWIDARFGDRPLYYDIALV